MYHTVINTNRCRGTPKGGVQPTSFPHLHQIEIKKNTSCRYNDMKYFMDFLLSQNQPLKSAD